MKFRKTLCILLAAILLLGCLAGCQGTAKPEPGKDPDPSSTQAAAPENEPVPAELLSAVTNAKALGFSAFDNQLVEYLKQTGKADRSFTVSPLSFKAALAMAVLGAEGETRTQLLEALGFRDLDELRAWYATVLDGVDDFDAYFGEAQKEAAEIAAYFPDSSINTERTDAYRVVNSVWSNQDLPGAFRKSFLEDAEKSCRAEAHSARAAELAHAVNAWVNEQTKGLIPAILDNASDLPAILVNALYLKTGWENSFYKTEDLDFTTKAGETVRKPFMNQREYLSYYEDEATRLVSVPLEGGVSMVFILGDDTGFSEKLAKAEYRLVDVTVPMFDLETSLDRGELCGYLRLMGCDRMFSPEDAEFGPMFTEPLFVGDIVQKAKVHIDEEGLEAAAVTAIMMPTACEPGEPEEPVYFRADRPFSFCILKNGEAPELLFWGQVVD